MYAAAPSTKAQQIEKRLVRGTTRTRTKAKVIPIRQETSAVIEQTRSQGDETSLLEEMNRKHAIVSVGGKTRVLTEHFNPETQHMEYPLSLPVDLKQRYSNRLVGGWREEVGKWWLDHPERRQYEGIVFSPEKDIPGYFNLWKGFAVKPRKGSCLLFLTHIRENLCNGDEALYKWVIGWMADAVQHLTARPGTALVLRGKQGTGKGVFARHFGALFGQHYRPISQPRHLTGHFNAHLQDCLLLFVDEGFWAGDKAGEGVLKALITAVSYTHLTLPTNREV